MSPQSRRLAGILLVVLPTVIYGGVSILWLLVGTSAYAENELRRDLWGAGHGHAGLLLVLSLVVLRYVDEANLSNRLRIIARYAVPASAVLLPAAFFLSVLDADATEPNALIYLAYVGAVVLALGLAILGVGLVRKGDDAAERNAHSDEGTVDPDTSR